MKFEIEAPAKVTVGEVFRVGFVSREEVVDFRSPQISHRGMEYISGPSTSKSLTTTFINGKTEHENKYFHYLLYRADRTGVFKFGPATAISKDGGLAYGSEEFTVTARYPEDVFSKEDGISDNELLVLAFADRYSITEGDKIRFYIKILSRYDILHTEYIAAPSFTGFDALNLNTAHLEPVQEVHNGIVYKAVIHDEYLLTPESTGSREVGECEIEVEVFVPARKTVRMNPEGSGIFFQTDSDNHTVKKRLHIEPVALLVAGNEMETGIF